MLLIYSDATGNRWPYIADFLIGELAGYSYKLTRNISEYLMYNGPRMNYSRNTICEGEFHIIPDTILYEEGIRIQETDVFDCKDYPAFFRSPVESNWPFDIFAASFYLISRYEEYLNFKPDEYGRYAHTESLAFRGGFLHRPLVNEWVIGLKKKLSLWFPELWPAEKHFRFIPTYDIDIAYSYLYKGLQFGIAASLRSLVQLEFGDFRRRLLVLMEKMEDPYDVYEWLYALHLKYMLRPIYFFLVAEARSKYDKNITPHAKPMQDLIRHHSMGYNVGIHPSWQSGDNTDLIRKEKSLLSEIAGKPIECGRQHYIRFLLPETYRLLLENGIRHEYSMGYGSINGFRASVSSPYSWYDLSAEKVTSLKIHPFCFMDANSFYEQKFTPAQAFEEIKYYHDVVKKVKGELITIWHNQFFGTDPVFKEWKEVYTLFLKEVVYWDV